MLKTKKKKVKRKRLKIDQGGEGGRTYAGVTHFGIKAPLPGAKSLNSMPTLGILCSSAGLQLFIPYQISLWCFSLIRTKIRPL